MDQELYDKACAQFPDDKFVHFGPRCVFIEHTVPTDNDGQRASICYDRPALLQMVHWANYRIRNSDNFAAISDGHTPSSDERASGAPIPEVLGYAGPFYIGLLGDVDPKWAIYAEEWVHRADVPRFERLQRRSPEVWINEPIERRTMDPIAALGAETPRLDSGMNPYSRVSDGQTVMRYSAMALPGPSNTFVPAGNDRTQLYSGDSSMDDPIPGADNKSTPYLLNAVQAAIEDLMPSILQAVHEQLVGAAADQSDDVPNGDADDDSQATIPDGSTDETGDMDDEEKSQYGAMSADCRTAYLAGRRKGRSVLKYSRTTRNRNVVQRIEQDGVDLHRVVARQHAQLNELRNQLEHERRDTSRYSRLNDLAREFAFDVKDESETCRDMTDPQFERHCQVTIAKYARRDDVTNVELFNDPTLASDRSGPSSISRVKIDQIERYSREAATIAARKNADKRGSTTFEAEFEALCKQHGIAV